MISVRLLPTIVLTVVVLCSGCAASSSRPLIADAAFAPVTPVQPPTLTQVTGSIFNDNQSSAGFGFKKRYQVGDIITVVITEATQAQRQSGVETTREGSNNPLFQIQKAFTLDSNNIRQALKATPFDDLTIESKGEGTANQAASLNGAVAASVIQVLPNDALLVQGQKRITLSEGSEVIQILGVVSTGDIQPDNTVLSSRLANAQISYQGYGNLASAAQIPWGTDILHKIWPF